MHLAALLVAILPAVVLARPYLPLIFPLCLRTPRPPEVPVIPRDAFEAAALELVEAGQIRMGHPAARFQASTGTLQSFVAYNVVIMMRRCMYNKGGHRKE
ncbi:predicted protein [Verticillium alfalfae VaMs.102]|uniref:Predicted protein n=1 Tax=Verticillium alfalfae (strain VaMs.102 / ATCC MYA-4576 / FGSC 10136) TaxID=526221 RepID=C9S9A3_VERA1|nr:predicted protein [Verticillium alfalfae VaMs.102]EEY15006.1 predicted protein [Verticillium alfalfae VaMs.102]